MSLTVVVQREPLWHTSGRVGGLVVGRLGGVPSADRLGVRPRTERRRPERSVQLARHDPSATGYTLPVPFGALPRTATMPPSAIPILLPWGLRGIRFRLCSNRLLVATLVATLQKQKRTPEGTARAK